LTPTVQIRASVAKGFRTAELPRLFCIDVDHVIELAQIEQHPISERQRTNQERPARPAGKP
jgi:hypothetical protein